MRANCGPSKICRAQAADLEGATCIRCPTVSGLEGFGNESRETFLSFRKRLRAMTDQQRGISEGHEQLQRLPNGHSGRREKKHKTKKAQPAMVAVIVGLLVLGVVVGMAIIVLRAQTSSGVLVGVIGAATSPIVAIVAAYCGIKVGVEGVRPDASALGTPPPVTSPPVTPPPVTSAAVTLPTATPPTRT